MNQTIYNTIKKYRRQLEDMGITVKTIFLYGSYAYGNASSDSDIDLIVISNDFKSMDLWERLCLLGRARGDITTPIEILGFTEEEFAEKQEGTFIGDEVKAKGVEIE